MNNVAQIIEDVLWTSYHLKCDEKAMNRRLLTTPIPDEEEEYGEYYSLLIDIEDGQDNFGCYYCDAQDVLSKRQMDALDGALHEVQIIITHEETSWAEMCFLVKEATKQIIEME